MRARVCVGGEAVKEKRETMLVTFIFQLRVKYLFVFQVCIIGDSVGSILAYDALCRNVKRSASDGSVADADISPGGKLVRFNLFEVTFYEL